MGEEESSTRLPHKEAHYGKDMNKRNVFSVDHNIVGFTRYSEPIRDQA